MVQEDGNECYLTDSMPTVSSANETVAPYGNFMKSTLLGDRIQIESFISPHRYFESDELGVRLVARYDIVTHEAGNGSAAGAYSGLLTAT